MADPEFLLLGDALWLEFINTASTPPEGRDTIPDPAAFLHWTKAVRVEEPAGASAYEDMRRFRDQLVSLADGLEQGRSAPPSVIEAINTRLAGLQGQEHLVRVAGAWCLRFGPGRPPSALEAVAQSVAQTLANPVATVRRCANPGCRVFLLDDSPNQSRRWCSRARCGNRGRIERRRTTRPAPLVSED